MQRRVIPSLVFALLALTAANAEEKASRSATVEFAGEAVQRVAFAAENARLVVSQFEHQQGGTWAVEGGGRTAAGQWEFKNSGTLASAAIGEKPANWSVDMNKVIDPRPECVLAVPAGFRPHDGAPQTAHSVRYDVGISPDGKLAATSSYRQPTVRLWDAATGKHARYLEFGKHSPHVFHSVYHPTFSPDGNTLAAFCQTFGHQPLSAEQWTLILWDVKTGKAKKHIVAKRKDKMLWRPQCMAWTLDGKRIVAAGRDRICSWDVSVRPRLVHDIACKNKHDFAIAMPDRSPAVECVTVSRIGKSLEDKILEGSTPEDKTVEINTWDLEGGKLARTTVVEASLAERVATAFMYTVSSVAPDGARVALPLSDGDVAVVDASSGKLDVLLPAKHKDNVSSLAFSSDGKLLASSGTREKAVKIWKLRE